MSNANSALQTHGVTAVCLWPGLFVETVHPVFGSASMEGRRARRSLKRLDFVRAYSEYYWSKANNLVAAVYSNSRALVPSALNSSIRAVEDKVTELGTPLLAAVQSRSEQVLTSLDRKVLPPCRISTICPHVACMTTCTTPASRVMHHRSESRLASKLRCCWGVRMCEAVIVDRA